MPPTVERLRTTTFKLLSSIRTGSRFADYIKLLAQDYATSGRDALEHIRNNTFRSFLWFTGLCSFGTTITLCPNEEHYFQTLIASCVDVWEVPVTLQNPETTSHVHRCLDSWSRERLRVSYLGFCSVVWQDDRTKRCQLFSEACKYSFPANGGGEFTGLVRLLLYDRLQESGLQRISNIVANRLLDIGFMGRWWIISSKMQDYDVNPGEWFPPSTPCTP